MMNPEQVRALAEILKENELSVLELSSGGERIRLERSSSAAIPRSVPKGTQAVSVQSEGQDEKQHCTEIKSPMVGVFYAAPSPDAEPFVKTGSRVKKGDVLCVIEAMKLMNEVGAEQDGTIIEVCVENGDVVEYGQTLFKLA